MPEMNIKISKKQHLEFILAQKVFLLQDIVVIFHICISDDKSDYF